MFRIVSCLKQRRQHGINYLYQGKTSKKVFFFSSSIVSFSIFLLLLFDSVPQYTIDILSVTHRLKCECAASRWYRIFRSESVCGRLYISVLNAHFVSMIVLQVLQPDSQLFGNDNEPISTFIQLNSSLSRLNCLKDSVKYSFFVLLSNSLLLSRISYVGSLYLCLSCVLHTQRKRLNLYCFLFLYSFLCDVRLYCYYLRCSSVMNC